MYQISQLMSTPVANSPRWNRDCAGELSPTCLFPSFTSDLLEGENSFECCCTDPLTGSLYTCRRSPRLLTNGYYIWTEDSFLCDKEGNVTLSPSQTRVMYKENLVRIFRKKRRLRRSLSSFFNLSTSEPWLPRSVFGELDSDPSEDAQQEGIRRLDAYPGNQSGHDFGCSSLLDGGKLEMSGAESMVTSSSGHILPQPPRGSSQDSSIQSLLKASGHFQESIVNHSKTSLFREVFFQTVLLSLCLIISACTRWLIGGALANVFAGTLMITIACIITSLFLSFSSYFKATSCARKENTENFGDKSKSRTVLFAKI